MMTMMEGSSIPPLLIRNLISSIFIFADKSLLNLSQKSKLLQLIRCVLVTSFLFFLRLLPPLNPSDDDVPYRKGRNKKSSNIHEYEFQIPSSVAVATANTGDSGGSAGSAVGRALSQLLSLMNDIPVSSRKYQVVRSLAETLIEDNHKEGVEALRQVNRTVLSAAFSRTLGQLEAAAALEQQVRGAGDGSDLVGPVRPAEYRLSRVLRAVRSIGDVAWLGAARASGSRSSAEKLAAEVLWLAEKLAACGYGDEAVVRWASASNLAWVSVSVEPSLQASLVKVSGRRERCSWCGVKLVVPAEAQTIQCGSCHRVTRVNQPSINFNSMIQATHNSINHAVSRLGTLMVNAAASPSSSTGTGWCSGAPAAACGYYNPPPPPPSQPSWSSVPKPLMPPSAYGRKRALLCGVSYHGRSYNLKGTVNDVNCMKYFLVDRRGFPADSILMLTEYEADPYRIPTKQNIRMALQWLVQGCRSGDSLVFHFSGHGSTQPDYSMDEIDGSDETLCPVDFETQGMILDDEINATIVRPLPHGAKLHAIIDACHSGTVLDLPFLCRMNREGYAMCGKIMDDGHLFIRVQVAD